MQRSQAQDVTNMIAQEVDAIFVNPNDVSGIVPALMEAKAAGIVVAIFSSELAPENQQYRDFTVSADDYLAGKAAAGGVCCAIPERREHRRDRRTAGHDAQLKRHQGFVDGLEGSNINVLEVQNCTTWSASDALNIMQDYIDQIRRSDRGCFLSLGQRLYGHHSGHAQCGLGTWTSTRLALMATEPDMIG